MRSITTATLIAVLMSYASGIAQTPADTEAVRLAATDYVEAIYNAQPERIRRSVHPSLVKKGYFKQTPTSPYTESPMSFDQLIKVAETWNKDGKRDTSIKEVKVIEVLDQIAAAKIVAAWGVDYLLLAKTDGQWKIHQILWQGPPVKSTR